MTDSWTETIAKLNASGQVTEDAAAPVSENHPEPVAGPASWQPYGLPGHASPEPEATSAAAADPLILELEHPLAEPAPADHAPAAPLVADHLVPPPVEAAHMLASTPSAIDPPPSVYGRVEPPLAIEPEVAELAPTPAVPPPLAPVEAPVAVADLVAPPEKPVEPELERAEPAPVVAVAPEPAPIVAAEPPPPASPALTETLTPAPELVPVSHTPISHTGAGHDAIDPVLAGFDHVVALAGYVLLFISVFMFGVPALATMALAYAHKNDSHLLVRSHYRFQLRIFWTAILFALLAIGSAITAGGMAITTLVDFARAHLPGVGAAMDQAHVGAWSGQISGLLLVAAVTLGVLAVVWTLVASLFGFLRLVGNRPIGHGYAAR